MQHYHSAPQQGYLFDAAPEVIRKSSVEAAAEKIKEKGLPNYSIREPAGSVFFTHESLSLPKPRVEVLGFLERRMMEVAEVIQHELGRSALSLRFESIVRFGRGGVFSISSEDDLVKFAEDFQKTAAGNAKLSKVNDQVKELLELHYLSYALPCSELNNFLACASLGVLKVSSLCTDRGVPANYERRIYEDPTLLKYLKDLSKGTVYNLLFTGFVPAIVDALYDRSHDFRFTKRITPGLFLNVANEDLIAKVNKGEVSNGPKTDSLLNFLDQVMRDPSAKAFLHVHRRGSVRFISQLINERSKGYAAATCVDSSGLRGSQVAIQRMDIENFRLGLHNRRVLVGTTAILKNRNLTGVRNSIHFNPNGRQDEFRAQIRMLDKGGYVTAFSVAPGGSELRGSGSYASVIARS